MCSVAHRSKSAHPPIHALCHCRCASPLMGSVRSVLVDLEKRNTFFDFVDCASALVAEGVATPGKLSCEGRSAGGLLVGNVINDAPELFKAAVAGVPFVDLMT